MTDGPLPPPPPLGYTAGDSASRSRAPAGAGPDLPDAWSQALPPDDPQGPDQPHESFRPADFWRSFGLAAGTFIFLFLLGVGIFQAIEPDPSENIEDVGSLAITLVLDVIALMIVPIIVLGGRRRASRLLGLRRPRLSTLACATAAFVAAELLVIVYVVIVEAIGVESLEPDSPIDADIPFTVEAAVLWGVLAILIAPVTEEIFNRGLVAGALAQLWNRWVGILTSAGLFSVLHFDVGSLIPFFFVGVVFAVVYLRTRDLGATVLAHFAFNLLAFSVVVADRGVS